MCDDQRVDVRVVFSTPSGWVIAVESRTALLSEASELAHPIRNLRVRPVGLFHGAPLANGPGDIPAREIHDCEGSHCHSPGLEGAVDLRGQGAFVQEKSGLTQVLLEHPVTDEAIAHSRHHADLAYELCERHRGGQHVGRCKLAAHDFEEPHDICGAEEMQTHHIRGPASRGGDLVQVER
jgi:hypothetical protein